MGKRQFWLAVLGGSLNNYRIQMRPYHIWKFYGGSNPGMLIAATVL